MRRGKVSLDNPQSAPERIELPASMIEANLSTPREQIRSEYNITNVEGITARIVDAGELLELSGQGPIEIAMLQGNKSIAGRYALVWSGRWLQCELIDLGTGESVFGNLQVASWIH